MVFFNIFGHHSSVVLTKNHKLSVFFGHHSRVSLLWSRLKYISLLQYFLGISSLILTKNHKISIFFGNHSTYRDFSLATSAS